MARVGRGDFVALLERGFLSFQPDGMVRREAKGVEQECIRTWNNGRTFGVRCWLTGSRSGRRAGGSAFTGRRCSGFWSIRPRRAISIRNSLPCQNNLIVHRLPTNKAFKHWPSIFNNDSPLTSAILDRILHHAEAIVIEGKSYRMKDRIEP